MVIKQSSLISHILTSYRSLMNNLNTFVKAVSVIDSKFVAASRQKIRSEIKELVRGLKNICTLLQLPFTDEGIGTHFSSFLGFRNSFQKCCFYFIFKDF